MESDHINVLKTGTAEERIFLLQKLAKSDKSQITEEILNTITELSADADIGVKFWAKKTLAKFQPANRIISSDDNSKSLPISMLLQKLDSASGSSFVSIDTIKKLCDSKDPQVLQPLITYLQNCKDIVQISYLTKQLGVNFPSEELIPTLMPFLKHTDDRVVGNTIEGLEGIQSEKCVAIFSQLLVHKSNRVKANAAKALSRFDKESTLPILTEMLQMKDKPHYVISACFAAKELKEDSLLDYLNPLLDDDLTFADALKAIEAYGSKAAVDTLQTAMGFTEDADKKAAIEESIKRIKSGKNASPTTQQSSHNSKSNDAARQASAAAKLAVKTLASKVEEIPQSYFDAIKELYNDPFKGQEKAIGILNEKETQITGGILALLLPLSGLFIAFWYLPPMLKTTEFYFRALILFLLFPVSFIAAFAIIGSTITAENPGKDVAIFAGGLALVPAAIALVICGLIGPGNIELSLIFAVYGLLATFMNVQASLTYLYKMPTYKCMLLSPAIFVIAGYIFKVLLFTIIPSGPHHPY